MTKEIATTIGNIVIGILICASLTMALAYSETHYTKIGTVEKQSENNYYFYDLVGNVWEFTSDEELTSDMYIEVFMFDNCTEEYIDDDMIIDYKVLSGNET